MEGLGLTGCKAMFQESLVREIDAAAQMNNHDAETLQAVPVKRSRDREEADEAVPATRSRDREETLEAFPVTRSRVRADTTITTPAVNSIISGDRTTTEHETRTISPELEITRSSGRTFPDNQYRHYKTLVYG
jgi:hypothetical protein